MDGRPRWVLLAYRLPREPSTPRIGVWRQLRRLGVGQIADGVVALPLEAQAREQLDWLAQDVIDHGGEATLWLAEPGSAAHGRALAGAMAASVAVEYGRLIAEAAAQARASEASRRRTVGRLRRELRRIGSRDYSPGEITRRAHAAVEALGQTVEEAAS